MPEKGYIRRAGRSVTSWYTETAQDVVDFLEALLAVELSPAGMGKLIVSKGKIMLQLDPKAIAAAAGGRLPLQPYDASSGSSPRIGVEEGTFGGVMPTLGGFALNSTPKPFIAVTTATRLIYLHNSISDEGAVTASEVLASNSVDPPDNTTSNHYVRLASVVVTVTGGVAAVAVGTPNLRGSQSYELCGGTIHLHVLI